MRTLSEAPTTADEFAQSLIDDGIADWLLDKTPDFPEVSRGQSDTVEESPTERPRDPETGRFVSKATVEETEEVETPEAPEEDTAKGEETSDENVEDEDHEQLAFELDPEALSVLDKYDGDLNKALSALKESQSLIGRQGNELGELRQQLAELVELVQANQANSMLFAPYRNSLEDDPQALVIEVLERAQQTGYFDEETYAEAIVAWGEEDPFGAARLDAQVQFAKQQAAAIAAQQQSAIGLQQDGDLKAEMAAVVQRHPDVEKYLPAVGEIAKEFPTLRASMAHGTAAERAKAFEELVRIAKSRAAVPDTSSALKRVVLKTQEEVRKEKADAAVISAGRQTAATAAKTGIEAFYEAFDRATGQTVDD
ncbi:MAG: hypothetical protein KatS3mg015_2802 [Fimbriimonadales bacterium]|nr:MAG: hypothetical protein KatS3mg015_2802 [Fimbriimonadales bacterium]